MKKICGKCKVEKDINCFSKKCKGKSGTQLYVSYCRECNIEYQKNHYIENKEYYINKRNEQKISIRRYINSKKNHCEECGEDHIACLDFHHKDRNEKTFDMIHALNYCVSIKNIQKEIDKCVVLCSNCHRKLHYNDRGR